MKAKENKDNNDDNDGAYSHLHINLNSRSSKLLSLTSKNLLGDEKKVSVIVHKGTRQQGVGCRERLPRLQHFPGPGLIETHFLKLKHVKRFGENM